jgi:PKHD-type hydroxylase|tara:strand:+ start:89 stop:643 length:555 start_codon:yes stop_codon:yes gene_type:complete
MENKRVDYWLSKKVFPKNKIEELDNFSLNHYHSDEPRGSGANNKNLKTKLIRYGEIKHLLSDLVNAVLHVNENKFGFHVYPQRDNNLINYNVYDSKTKGDYGWHTDSDTDEFTDMKLTCLINISTEPYQGGDFFIFNGGSHIVKEFNEPGDVLILKSFINHKVTPVISGIRKTLALFFYGPLFR